jgi:hypothetical protein
MSQLPIHLNKFIERKIKNKFKPDAISNFLENVTKNHFIYLNSFKCPVILITDIETHYFDKEGKLLQKDLNYSHLKLPKASEEWSWNVAPIPEFDKKIAIKMLVQAFVIENTNSR